MKKSGPYSIVCTLALALTSSLATAQSGTAKAPGTGEQVYKQVCIACHSTGVASAPKLGDENAWAPLIEEGQHILTAHAWVGVRAMPAQGGAPDLTLSDFADAVAWMASASGGDWKTPDAEMMERIRHEAAERLEKEIKEKKALLKKLEHD
ncbi:MAG: cytochrome c5 family protein [Pusillimonas sp.]|nr:cytochrome c5 family protein [Pusillimonas sp.]